jgi:hypothetical protein
MHGRGPTYAAIFFAGALVLTAFSTQLFPIGDSNTDTAIRLGVTMAIMPLALAGGWFYGRYLDRRDGDGGDA